MDLIYKAPPGDPSELGMSNLKTVVLYTHRPDPGSGVGLCAGSPGPSVIHLQLCDFKASFPPIFSSAAELHCTVEVRTLHYNHVLTDESLGSISVLCVRGVLYPRIHPTAGKRKAAARALNVSCFPLFAEPRGTARVSAVPAPSWVLQALQSDARRRRPRAHPTTSSRGA